MEEADFQAVAQQIAAMPLTKVAKHQWTEDGKAGATERVLRYQDSRYQFGGALARRCHCGQPVMGNSNKCRFHGGKPTKERPPWRVFARYITRLRQEGRLPAELLDHPCWPAVRRVVAKARFQEPVRALIISACEMQAGDKNARTRFVQALARLKKEGLTW